MLLEKTHLVITDPLFLSYCPVQAAGGGFDWMHINRTEDGCCVCMVGPTCIWLSGLKGYRPIWD